MKINKIKQLKKTELFRKEYTAIRKEALSGGNNNHPKRWDTFRGGGGEHDFYPTDSGAWKKILTIINR